MRGARTETPGPSPRVRGAVAEGVLQGLPYGTIPAGAQSRTDEQSLVAGLRGPSPRVQGAGLAAQAEDAAQGTIPAGAGSRWTA